MDLLARIDTTLLYPPFLELLKRVLAECRQEGADYWAISGLRPPEEQAKLYFQGRTSPGAIVTNCQPWNSAHQYGIAVDLCRDADVTRAGLQPSWKREDYALLGRVCDRRGLTWGGTFKFYDAPHVQWPGYVSARELAPLKAAATKPPSSPPEYLRRVWDVLDQPKEKKP